MVRGAAKPPEGELEAIARAAFLQGPSDVKFNCSLPDSEKFRDLAVPQSLRNQVDDCNLAFAEWQAFSRFRLAGLARQDPVSGLARRANWLQFLSDPFAAVLDALNGVGAWRRSMRSHAPA
jgi:hypothetical protein